jgi:hypothetical protein
VTASPRYPWTRWWLPIGIEPLLTSGFFDDPAGPFAAYLDSRAVRLADCDETSCVVLFGDAGMGKSTELEDERARHHAAGTASVLLDLGEDETWTDARNLLLSHPDVVAWQAAADGKLVVLVDSVDEASTSMRKLADQLLRLLDDLPLDRLLLRVASRSAAFPMRLREKLSARFEESYRELNLAPLTWADAAQAAAAESRNGDASGFMTAVVERGIGVLASRPMTLGMLLGLYGEGPLPTSRIDLYERAIGRLVREMNRRRLDESVQDIPVTQRLEAAQTLAAITVLAGHASIALHRYPNMPEGQLCLDEVTGPGDEPKVFAAVAGSALFTATSESTVRWTHRDFPEFLTGQCLAALDTRDVLALLSDPNDPDRIVPQLIGACPPGCCHARVAPDESVKGHQELPGDGHEICPLVVTRSARWRPPDGLRV